MDIKDITILSEKDVSSLDDDREEYFVIGTHNGIFHSDEVVATALLSMLHADKKIVVVRTRNDEILKKCDICVDVGGGKYDHHLPGYDRKRDDEKGIPYASAGLVFDEFGRSILQKLNPQLSEEEIEGLFKRVDSDVIQPVDAEDNGKKAKTNLLNLIPLFHPSWYEENPDYDAQFSKALEWASLVLEKGVLAEPTIEACQPHELLEEIEAITKKQFSELVDSKKPLDIEKVDPSEGKTASKSVTKRISEKPISDQEVLKEFLEFIRKFQDERVFEETSKPVVSSILEQKLRQLIDMAYAQRTIESLVQEKDFFENNILQIPAQTMPWVEAVCGYNEEPKHGIVNFVMFPHPSGDYAAQCVPPSISERFGQRVAFPKEWTLKYPFEGITFMHKGGFFARGNKDSMKKLCVAAIEREEEKWARAFEGYGERTDSTMVKEAAKRVGILGTSREKETENDDIEGK